MNEPVASWEQFARQDAQYYIDPTLGPGADVEAFREGGRGIVEWAIGWAGELPAHDRALEIGCGLGRNTVHLARTFAAVDGVDISPTMVRSALAAGVPEGVHLHALSGRDLRPLPDDAYDFVFSHLVFQHIESASTIAAYVTEVARVLRPGGVAVLHFDTRPMRAALRLVYALPDRLLPRDRRRGIRRHRRRAAQVRAYGRSAGLALEAEMGAASAHHWLRWRAPRA